MTAKSKEKPKSSPRNKPKQESLPETKQKAEDNSVFGSYKMASSKGNVGATDQYPEVQVADIGDHQVDINIKKSIAADDAQPQSAETSKQMP